MDYTFCKDVLCSHENLDTGYEKEVKLMETNCFSQDNDDSVLTSKLSILCFSFHLQQSTRTELCTPPQHVSSKHLCQPPLQNLYLFSASERLQHVCTWAHCDIILILPPGQPVAAEYFSGGHRYLTVWCLKLEMCTEILRRRFRMWCSGLSLHLIHMRHSGSSGSYHKPIFFDKIYITSDIWI